MKKLLSLMLVLLVLLSCTAAANAQGGVESIVSLRIEGINSTLYDGVVALEIGENTTVKDVLTALTAANESVKIVGLDTNYITEINGDKAAAFGGWDGWYYAVNDKAAQVGIDGYVVSPEDSIVLYYGDFPCQYPVVDYSEAANGVLTITSYDAEYDEYYNATFSYVPVTDATVTLNGDKYTTDKDGKVNFNVADYSGFISVQISKESATGAPAVCRFAPDEGFTAAEVQKQTSIKISGTYKLYVNDTKTLNVSVSSAVGKTTFSSDNKSVAAVSAKGKITAKKAGTAYITVSNNNVSKKVKVKVSNPSLKVKSATVKVGKKYTIKVNGSGKFIFKSSNKKIASVTSKGVVKGVKKGSAVITVTANGKKLKFKVVVKK